MSDFVIQIWPFVNLILLGVAIYFIVKVYKKVMEK